MNALEMIGKWEVANHKNQKETINVLKKYILRLHDKSAIVIKLRTGLRGIESESIHLNPIYEFERTINDNITLIEKPEDETDERNYLSAILYHNPSLFYYCSFAYDGKINPRIISREVSQLELPLEIKREKVKDNDVIFIFLDDEKSRVDKVFEGVCKQMKMKDILIANATKILVLILLISPADKE